MPQNFVTRCSFGKYDPNKVLPAHAFVGHDTDELQRLGLIEPTDAPCTEKVDPPAPLRAAQSEDVYRERNRLAEENEQLRQREKQYEGAIDELKKARDAHKGELPKYVEENNHLRGACKDHQAKIDAQAKEIEQLKKRNAELTADLEAATAPKGAAGPQGKPADAHGTKATDHGAKK